MMLPHWQREIDHVLAAHRERDPFVNHCREPRLVRLDFVFANSEFRNFKSSLGVGHNGLRNAGTHAPRLNYNLGDGRARGVCHRAQNGRCRAE